MAQLKRLSPYFLFLPLFLIGIYFRFNRLQDVGIEYPDSFFYWQTAFDWYHGTETLTEHFRPFIYWLYSKVMMVIGPSEWSIRFFNASCDCLVGCLIVQAGWILRRSVLLGLTAAVSYFFLLQPLMAARSETVAIPSSLFLLLAFNMTLLWTQNQKAILIFLAGTFLGMSWMTHPDLAVLGSSLTIIILVKLIASKRIDGPKFWPLFFKFFGLFLLGYFLVFGIFLMKFGLSETLENFLENHKSQTKSLKGNLPWRLAYYSYHYIRINLGKFGLILFLMSCLSYGHKIIKGKFSSQDIILLSFPLLYLFFCALLFARTLIPRLLIPLVPMILLTIFIQVYDLLPKWRRIALISLGLLFVFINHQTWSFSRDQNVSIYKKIDERYSPMLKENSKLLIGPIATNHIHSPLTRKVYLGGKGFYLSSSKEASLNDVVIKNAITHVWIADILYDERVFGKNLKFTYEERLKTLFNMDPKSYTVEAERSALRSFLKDRAELKHKSNFGELYELK